MGNPIRVYASIHHNENLWISPMDQVMCCRNKLRGRRPLQFQVSILIDGGKFSKVGRIEPIWLADPRIVTGCVEALKQNKFVDSSWLSSLLKFSNEAVRKEGSGQKLSVEVNG
ncbi:hypothetical protein Salat_0686500 [Sesamum alatum]|uniref:Uncharacterized protein n=1 Tax=Sesamum alatum TaxID=300844 RepID=A0AAE1YS91_9LAMI|nr:hypothetical protein Salat_0686500 [Sesamum alatum]